ncbi:MAG: hypothetical protein MJ238_00185 [Bacilli bacterium]|nr:hypothetical protein [Bacilli bacterium]
MNSVVTNASICVEHENIIYRLSSITHIENEDGTFKYIFKPNFSVIDIVDPKCFAGIPGLNLDLRKEVYVRENVLPVFISERVPQENREDYWEMLESVGMDYMNPLEYLMRVKTRYSGDKLIVLPHEEKKTVDIDDSSTDNIPTIIKRILDELAKGNDVFYSGEIIDDENRQTTFSLLRKMYQKSSLYKNTVLKHGRDKAKLEKKYLGRKPIEVDEKRFREFEELVKSGRATYRDVSEFLDISIDKYYRYRKQLRKKENECE